MCILFIKYCSPTHVLAHLWLRELREVLIVVPAMTPVKSCY